MKILKTYKYFLLLFFLGAVSCYTPLLAISSAFSVEPLSEISKVDKYTTINEEKEKDKDKEKSHYIGSKLRNLLKDTDKVILTFDDGPSPHSTPKILSVLKKYNIKAVFFVLGCQAHKYPKLIKQISDEGHIIGNHTYNHVRLSSLTGNEVRNEIRKTNELIKSIVGKKPVLMRPPYGDGATNKKLQKIASEEGVSFFLWTVDPADWKSRNSKKIIESTERQLCLTEKKKKGGVILMHDIYTTTADSLETLICDMKKAKYCFISPNEINKSDEEIRFAQNSFEHKSFDPRLSGNNMIVALLDPEHEKLKTIDVIKEYRQGNLMLYLALHN